MARKEIPGIEDKLIEATLEVAGNDVRGTFSTKEIGTRCGVSEFTVFDHFTSKEHLIDVCNQVVFDRFFALESEARLANLNNPEGFFNQVLDRLLAVPSLVRFAGNYSLVFPREGSLEKYEAFSQMCTERWKDSTPLLPGMDKGADYFSLLAFAAQELIQDALYILSGEIKDTPEVRKAMYGLVFGGLSDFVKIM